MDITAKKSLIFIEKSPHLEFAADAATRQGAFYQQLVSEVLGQAILKNGQIEADKLVSIAAAAHRQHQTEIVELASGLLANLPFGIRYRSFARYFEGLCLYRRKKFAEAKAVFEGLLPSINGKLKARTLMALAAVIHDSKSDLSLPYYLEAGTIAGENWCDPYTFVQVGRMIAVHKSIDGDHEGAVRYLERLFPISKAISTYSPFLFLEYLNSLAYENLETGRLKEASYILGLALASPLAKSFPECQETKNELAEKAGRASRSTIALNGWQDEKRTLNPTDNIIRLPISTSHHSGNTRHDLPARMIDFPARVIEASEKGISETQPLPSKPLQCEENGNTDYSIDCSTVRSLTLRFLDAAGQERMKLEVRHDEDGAVIDVWARDKDGNGNSFFSTCFTDNPAMEIDLP